MRRKAGGLILDLGVLFEPDYVFLIPGRYSSVQSYSFYFLGACVLNRLVIPAPALLQTAGRSTTIWMQVAPLAYTMVRLQVLFSSISASESVQGEHG